MSSRRFSMLSLCLTLALASVSGCQRAPLTALERAQASYQSGNWNETIAVCNDLLVQNPDDGSVLQLRGRAHLAMQDFEKSIADFSRLAELTPTDHEVYYYRSMAYEGMGEQALAEADRAKGRELDPLRKTAYAYSPSNFVPQSAPLPPTPRPVEREARKSRIPEEASAQAQDVGRDDFETEPPFTPLRSTNPSKSPGHDAEYVRDAVDDFRRMINETESMVGSKNKESKKDRLLAPGKLPDFGVDPEKMKGTQKPDIAKDKAAKPEADTPTNKPALSTAIPPGFAPMGGLPPVQSPYAIATQPGSLPPSASVPSVPPAGNAPLPNQIPTVLPYGLPAVTAYGGQTMIQPNPVHAPGSKPVLSTSLPTGPVPRAALGLSPPPAAAPYRSAPANAAPSARPSYGLSVSGVGNLRRNSPQSAEEQ